MAETQQFGDGGFNLEIYDATQRFAKEEVNRLRLSGVTDTKCLIEDVAHEAYCKFRQRALTKSFTGDWEAYLRKTVRSCLADIRRRELRVQQVARDCAELRRAGMDPRESYVSPWEVRGSLYPQLSDLERFILNCLSHRSWDQNVLARFLNIRPIRVVRLTKQIFEKQEKLEGFHGGLKPPSQFAKSTTCSFQSSHERDEYVDNIVQQLWSNFAEVIESGEVDKDNQKNNIAMLVWNFVVRTIEPFEILRLWGLKPGDMDGEAYERFVDVVLGMIIEPDTGRIKPIPSKYESLDFPISILRFSPKLLHGKARALNIAFIKSFFEHECLARQRSKVKEFQDVLGMREAAYNAYFAATLLDDLPSLKPVVQEILDMDHEIR